MHEPTAPPPTAQPSPGAKAHANLTDDPRALQILSTEHWSLLSARSLAYNEAFTRASMFLMFLSMSFVALALLAQAISFSYDFLIVVVVVLFLDFVIGLATYFRIMGTGGDDLRAMHGMNRIRHGYLEIAPTLAPYFTTGTYDDVSSVISNYGYTSGGTVRDLAYGLSTSLGMVGLIVAVLGGALAAAVTLALGGSTLMALAIGIIGSIVVFAIGAWYAFIDNEQRQAALEVRFPPPGLD